jgi:hypothetical protein
VSYARERQIVKNGCGLSKLDPDEFIDGFDLSAIARLHGDADKRSAPGGAQRGPNPRCADVGIDRATPSN